MTGTEAPVPPAAPAPPDPRELDGGLPVERYRARVLVLLLSLCLQVLTLGNRWGAPDERERVQAAERLIDHGTLRGADGRHTKYPPLTSVLLVPGVLLKRAIPGGDDAWLMLPSVLAGVACVVPFQRALWAVGVGMGPSVVAASIFALANPVWPYTKRLYSEPFTALFVLCAFAAALAYRTRGRRRSLVFTWLSLLGALGNNSVVLVLLPVLAGMTALKPGKRFSVDKRAAMVAVGAGTALVGLWLLTNFLKFGSPFSTGYHDTTIPNDVFDGRPGFSAPFLVGFYGLVMSAGRGLAFYAPLSLLGLWALYALRHRWLGAAPWLALGALVPMLVYSKWWSWHGGTCYGPRLMTPFIGLWMLGIGPLLVEFQRGRLRSTAVRVAFTVTTMGSVAASFVGTFFMFSYDQQFWIRDKPFNDYLDVYTPQFSALPRSLINATLFPDDVNWMWLSTSPRGPLVVSAREGERVVEVRLKAQALRDNWEVAEVQGVTSQGAEVKPVNVATKEGMRPEAMWDANLTTAWLGGTQRQGQWVRVEFAEPVQRVVFTHAREGAAYPKFPEVRTGVDAARLGPWVDVATERGPLGLRWPAWLCLLGMGACSRGIGRMAAERKGRARPPAQ
ncbi:MAG: hypothetical protein AB2A00_08135 [Myxococcota bacterium]